MSITLELVNKNVVKHHNLTKARLDAIEQQQAEILTIVKQLKGNVENQLTEDVKK